MIDADDGTNSDDAENVWIDMLENGYIRLTDGETICYMHQIEALREHSGFEVFDDSNQCHHRNKQRWDNRGENVDLVSNHHHNLIHNRGEWVEDESGEPIWDINISDVTQYATAGD